jgi:serpin B
LALLSDKYHAPFAPVDFENAPTETIKLINDWIAVQTKGKFTNLLSPGSVQSVVRMILVNAIYLKATWQHRFEPATARPFHLPDGTTVTVSTMSKKAAYGFKKRNHYEVITIPYTVPNFHFIILLPNEGQSPAAIENRLKPHELAKFSRTPYAAIHLFLPKFKIDPPNLELSGVLTKLGMKSAFNFRAANFGRMNPTLPLFVSSIHHKATLTVDEEGTEATAATWGVIGKGAAHEPIKEIHVDRPFLFTIQHRPSGACLFLGRVVDPREIAAH